MKTYVVVRRPVDWLNFLELDSVKFCRSVGYKETTIIDFCDMWRQSMRGSFQEVRRRVAEIARRSWNDVPNVEVVAIANLPDIRPSEEDRIILTDDDDWLSPEVASVPPDSVWGSLALVKVLHPPERIGDPVLIYRPLNRQIYTNNSSFSMQTLARLGLARLFGHWIADNAVTAGEYSPVQIGEYLSCANKHPCSAIVVMLNMQAAQFEVRSFVESYVAELKVLKTPVSTWLQPLRADLIRVF